MNYRKIFYSFLLISFVFLACKKEEDEEVDLVGNWLEKSDFEGVTRGDAVAFSIGKFGYVGTGYDGRDRLNDFWAYDSEHDYWVQIADFPGKARNSAVAFSINGKGYVGTGYDGDSCLNDFWEYDPVADTWTRKVDFGGSGRYGAVGFSINGKGYIGTGYDGNYLKDFWAYDPGTNAWEKIVSIGGSKRRDAVAFVLNDKGYVCTGISNGSYESDFWEYDPGTGLWTEKRRIVNYSDEDYDDDYQIVRSNALAFTMGDKAYITTGSNGSLLKTVWEYDAVTDLWKQKTSLEGVARLDAVAFTIEGGRGFVTTGRNVSYQFDDIWEFKPDEEYEEYD